MAGDLGLRFISSVGTLVCADEIAAVEPIRGTGNTSCAIILKGSGRVVKLPVSSDEVCTMLREATS